MSLPETSRDESGRGDQMPRNIDAIIAEFKQQTMAPVVVLEARRGQTTVFSSKLGGTPYLPGDMAYPRSENPHTAGAPLRLLAQLNFAELPKLPEFPGQGILQIFAEPDDLYGADFDHPTQQAGFRVFYHQEVERDPARLQTLPALGETEAHLFPFEGEFVLTGRLEEAPMSDSDYRFDKTFLDIYRRYHATDETAVWRMKDVPYERICEELSATGHHMGGYPYFTQWDPRAEKGPLAEYTTLLLQIDSDGHGDDEILWGDCGVAGFFITPEQLRARDFSKVLYNWDCS